MKVKIAAVQPRSFRDKEEWKNLPMALKYIDEAAQNGVQLVCFPEGYPGPYSGPMTFSATDDLCKKAEEHGIHLIAGSVEKASENSYYLTVKLIDTNGEIVGEYRRVQPAPAHVDKVLFGKKIAPGKKLDVFRTKLGNLGILICSEMYCPELSRVLALKGADIIFYPSGGMIYELTETWKTLIWARAIENLVYTVACQNIWGMEDGIATIAGPEEVLAESKSDGIIYATLDLDRLKWLREHEERLDLPKPYKTIPGLINWRKPELYRAIVSKKR